MTPRWATFDCYGTLIDWNAGLRAQLVRSFPAADPDRLLRTYHAVEPIVQHERALPYREVLTRSLLAVGAIDGVDLVGPPSALADSLPSWPPFPEVPAALRELRERGWKLAVLSNSDPDLLGASLANIGVDVDVQITADRAGSYKPAHGHWKTFFTTTNADPARHVHVAASAFHDLQPCEELDIPAVWINRLGETSSYRRAAELTDLSRLPEMLERLQP